MKKVMFDLEDGIGFITLNDPDKMNGFSQELVTDLMNAMDLAEQDDNVKVIVICGKGKAFCAGGDISLFDSDIVDALKYLDFVINSLVKIEKTLKPTIAAVDGFALGGGCELTMTCDIVIASEKALFGLPEVSIGIMPGFAVLRLAEIVGRTRAKELIMTGKRIDAEEAERIGLITKVVQSDNLMESVKEEAKLLMNMGPLSLKLAKSVVNRNLGGEEIVNTVNTTALFFGLEDLKEGQKSFYEKRRPMFRGR
ncbi:enoyl-CoA hydratase/isomerase family protein [Thermodesulfobacteriota bacterium]